MIKRVKHMIETAINITIVFIDYVVNSSIIRQITFSFNNTDKLNLRLVRVFTYFNQFRLNVKYQFEKLHIISNVLLKLSIALSSSFIDSHVNNFEVLNINAFFMRTVSALSKQKIFYENKLEILNLNIYHNELENPKIFDQIYIYQNILMIMSSKFKQRLIDEYVKKKS